MHILDANGVQFAGLLTISTIASFSCLPTEQDGG